MVSREARIQMSFTNILFLLCSTFKISSSSNFRSSTFKPFSKHTNFDQFYWIRKDLKLLKH